MANLLAQGAAWLADQLKTHASVVVVYSRGTDQVLLSATIGKTQFEFDDGSGALVRIQSRDFLVQAADLKLAGVETFPMAGDTIREAVGGTIHIYEVLAPGEEPPWRYSDPFRNLLRIHTKHVGTES